MGTTIQEVHELLDEMGYKKHTIRDDKTISIVFGTKTYVDSEGDNALLTVIRLDEDGEYITVYAPGAFKVTGAHVDVVLRVCAIIQWRTKLIQFEYDPEDGEIRPVVEFPLEDAKLTARQLRRCINGLGRLIEDFHAVIKKAATEGVIDLPSDDLPRGSGDTLLRLALAALVAEGRPADDPQVVALRALLAGSGGGPTEL